MTAADGRSLSLLSRMVQAVELVRERLERATGQLDRAGVPYAVIGGHAVAAWVSMVDVDAVRNTNDVDLLLRREDLERARAALEQVGFIGREVAGSVMFLDGPTGTARAAVQIVFAREHVRENYLLPAADVIESERPGGFQVLRLSALVNMKLTSFRDKDRTHLRDLIDVGLIDASWLQRVPEPLKDRLQQILESPEG